MHEMYVCQHVLTTAVHVSSPMHEGIDLSPRRKVSLAASNGYNSVIQSGNATSDMHSGHMQEPQPRTHT